MATAFAALIFRPAEVPDRALSRGFAVALAGYDVPSPHLLIAPLRGAPGYSAAFYASGLPSGRGDDELEHHRELFEDELSPPVAVLDAAAELAGATERGPTVYALIYSDDIVHDDGWRFEPSGFVRRFVREGEEALEAGVETPGESEAVEVGVDVAPDATEAEEREATERALRPHRGSTFLSAELGTPVLAALIGALFAPDRRLELRLVEPDPASIADEARRLNRALGRVDGRGAFAAPLEVRGVRAPAAYAAFVAAYDWADPADPEDLYRELAIGAIEGTLRFLREPELRALGEGERFAAASSAGLYPIARLAASALGGGGKPAVVALGPDGEALWIVRDGAPPAVAGPTFGELVRYLSLGWSRRSDAEEDVIGALMLRARLRTEKAA